MHPDAFFPPTTLATIGDATLGYRPGRHETATHARSDSICGDGRDAIVRSLIRTAAGRALRVSGGLRRGLHERGVVVAFHRVSNRSAGDPLTKSPADYRHFCSFFKANFDVVSLSEFNARVEKGHSVEGKLVITHDDGYLDNRTEAASILADLKLPATFFVTTDFIGSEIVPHWDADQGLAHPWMSWDDVRELRRMGFEIGSHGRTHANFGTIGPEQMARELADSRARIERELGELPEIFAYPYGGLANMNEVSREIVRHSGFRSCLSCCGGLVEKGADPFDLARVPISPWYENADQLALDLGLLRA